MLKVKADLHIHTVLSPCADLEMSPANIVKVAVEREIKIIGITDHNSTLQCNTVRSIAKDFDMLVLMGAEVTSREEVHSLAFFESEHNLSRFQDFLELKQPKIKNDPKKFGYQAVVDANDTILKQVDNYLGIALDAGIEEIEEVIHDLGGIFIPAHVDRGRYSLMSQLGFIPDDIRADAFEIYNRTPLTRFLKENSHLMQHTFVRNSDSHYLDSIGMYSSTFQIEALTFKEVRMALRSRGGRMVTIE